MTPHADRPRPGGTASLGGRVVSRVGYGAAQLGRLRADPERAVGVLRRALELGVDHLDTAQFYGDGFVNAVIGEALRSHSGVTVVTKVGADADPGGPFPMRPAQRPEELRASVEQNLRTLGVEQVPVVNLRRMDSAHAIPRAADQIVDLDDQLAEMSAMQEEGLIGGIGISSTTLDALRRALPVGIACVQNAYSLVERDDEAMLELCLAEGIAWVPYFPLGGAVPNGRKVVDQPEVQAIAAALGVAPSQVGLAWLLHHQPNILLIPGTASVDHLEANVAIGDVRLDPAMMSQLDHLLPPA